MRKVYERRVKAFSAGDIVKAVEWLRRHGNRRYAGMMLAVLSTELTRRGLEWMLY